MLKPYSKGTKSTRAPALDEEAHGRARRCQLSGSRAPFSGPA
jgi:hypothetical protein